MAGKLDGKAIEDGTISLVQLDSNLNSKVAGGGIKITSVSYSDANTFVSNGESVTVTGSGFDSNANVYIDGVLSSLITVSNSNSITFEVANVPYRDFTTRPYSVVIQNPNGSAAVVPWRLKFSPQILAAENYGYTSGGNFTVNTIDKFPFASDANASDVGDLTQSRNNVAGQSSSVSGYTSGGGTPPASNVIDKFPFATDANATDVGDLTQARQGGAGQSSDVSGYTSGGWPALNTIDKFPFASDANATDVGDLTVARPYSAGQSSIVSGYTSGGGPTASNVIDKFPFASNANATDVGDLLAARIGPAGQSSINNGYASGGYTTPPTIRYNTIQSFPFATNSPAVTVGFLISVRAYSTGQSSKSSGYSSGGGIPPVNANINNIEKFPFAATFGSTSDVGDLTDARYYAAGQQY